MSKENLNHKCNLAIGYSDPVHELCHSNVLPITDVFFIPTIMNLISSVQSDLMTVAEIMV